MEEFLEEIHEVCKKHGLVISHEDIGGCFIIERYNSKGVEWLMDAKPNHNVLFNLLADGERK